MKVSSYHHQKGDVVTFVQHEVDTKRSYDIIYLAKQSTDLKNPPADYFDRRTRLLGKGFKYLGCWKMPPVVLACRPDYLLYPDTIVPKIHFAQFFTEKGARLNVIQDYHNAADTKELYQTLIVDRAF